MEKGYYISKPIFFAISFNKIQKQKSVGNV